LHEADPTLSQVEIAEQLGINPGRVSEALAGKW
jgi:predicted XRE-type DNA-binding protein